MGLVRFFCSFYFSALLLIIYAASCAAATFIEGDVNYGVQAAQDLVYQTGWFSALHIILLLNLIGVFIYYRVWSTSRIHSIVLHLSFIVIVFGAAVTHFYGEEGILHIREGNESGAMFSRDDYINIFVQKGDNVYYSNFPVRYNAVTQTQFKEIVPVDENQTAIVEFRAYNSSNNKVEHDGHSHDGDDETLEVALKFNDKEELFILPKSFIGNSMNEIVQIDDVYFQLIWGPGEFMLPFSIYLEDFKAEKYGASNTPSAYSSDIIVKDPVTKEDMEYKIYMNNVLDYKGYRFFQSSYDKDEKGSYLSVNKDPGKIPTYIGYFMLTIGFILCLVCKNSRFMKLGRYIRKQQLFGFILFAFLFSTLFTASDSYAFANMAEEADNITTEDAFRDTHVLDEGNIKTLLNILRTNFKGHTGRIERIIVEDFQGRLQPFDSLAMNLTHKLIGKNGYEGLSNVELIMSMMMYYDYFQNVKMFPVKSDGIKIALGIPKTQKYISYNDAYNGDTYKLEEQVHNAASKNPADRSTLDKEVLKLDERLGIAYFVYTTQIFTVFPDDKTGNLMSAGVAIAKSDNKERTLFIEKTIKDFFQALDSALGVSRHFGGAEFAAVDQDKDLHETERWHKFDAIVTSIIDMQKQYNKNLPSSSKVNAEIILNHAAPFKKLIDVYLLVGLTLFILVIKGIIRNTQVNRKTIVAAGVVIGIAFIYNTIFLGIRWYVAGHAPWTNAYETMIYIAWICVLCGLLCIKRSLLAVSTATFMSGISLFVANLGFMDPQITPLLPVLKSYWLNIHVSVITASYGLFAICFILGVITMLLFILRDSSKPHIDQAVLNIHCINEMAMILGLGLMTVGTFIGGIWANESWGRYWGWDPKETWSLITIIVYTIILHLRFIPRFNTPYVFASFSMLGIYSMLMTYFGVNYYLSGRHSYASGDPIPIPVSLYVIIGITILLIIIGFRKRKLSMPNLNIE